MRDDGIKDVPLGGADDSLIEPLEAPEAAEELGWIEDEERLVEAGKWSFPAFDVPLLSPDDCLIVRPGEDFEILHSMPHRFRPTCALVLCRGELIAVEGRHRDIVRVPSAMSVSDPDAPVATRIVLVTIRHRTKGPRTRPLRYLIVTNTLGELLGWLDHSPPSWDFPVSQVEAVCTLAHLKCETEVFENEAEFVLAHPSWSR